MSAAWFAVLGVGALGVGLIALLHHRLARELSRLEAAVSALPRRPGPPRRPTR